MIQLPYVLSSRKFCEIANAKTRIEWQATGICFDSRNIKPGDLFFALKGQRDGHHYVADALQKGAVAAVVHFIPDSVDPLHCVVVQDPLQAMVALARKARELFKGKMIAITGSAGKTSVKEGLCHVLRAFGNVQSTKDNFNNHIGVPFCLAQLQKDIDYAVFELGMNHAGEIEYLTQLTQPHIATINCIYPMHIENFSSLEGIAYAKAEIYEGLVIPKIAIYNADTNHADILDQQAKLVQAEVISFGQKGIYTKLLEAKETEKGQFVKALINGQLLEFSLCQFGKSQIMNALNILTICAVLELDLERAATLLYDIKALPGRGEETKIPFNDGFYTLIDDSYSGQPDSMRLALELLSLKCTKGRKIVVLGQMAELGEHCQKEHEKIGALLSELSLDKIIFVGQPMRAAKESYHGKADVEFYENKEGLLGHLTKEILQEDDTLFIKGSRYGSRLFEVVAGLKEGKNETKEAL